MTRGESFSATLSEGTLVAMVRDPVSNQMIITAIPAEGRTDLDLALTLVAEDQHGNEITGTASLVGDVSTIPPKIVIPLTKK